MIRLKLFAMLPHKATSEKDANSQNKTSKSKKRQILKSIIELKNTAVSNTEDERHYEMENNSKFRQKRCD